MRCTLSVIAQRKANFFGCDNRVGFYKSQTGSREAERKLAPLSILGRLLSFVW